MKKKIILTFLLVLVVYIGCTQMSYSEFDDKRTLEDVMEMHIPDYHVKKYVNDRTLDFHGDFSDSIYIEFDSIPSKAFIDSVKMRVKADEGKEHQRWLNRGHKYRFQALHRDGGKVPKCREGQSDWAITLDFSDNSTKAVIAYWYW